MKKLALLLTSMLITTPVLARGEALLERAGAAIFKQSAAPGMVMVVVRGDQLTLLGYGETAPGSARKPDADSLLRVGSMSKVLATELMIRLADEGRVRLSDPLQKYAPPGVTVPTGPASQPISLLNLATHTSGLARAVEGKVDHQIAPFTWPGRELRWEWLQRQTLAYVPGSAALYSNVGYSLLGDALATAGRMPYPQLLRDRLTGPLGMNDTTASPTPQQCSRLLIGGKTNPTGPCNDTQATASSGGMYSSGADMARWMQHLLGIKNIGNASQTAQALAIYVQRQELASITGLDKAGRPSALGLGWVQLPGNANSPSILQKTGGGGGFMSYMTLLPGRRTGIFVSVTSMDIDMFASLALSVNRLVLAIDAE